MKSQLHVPGVHLELELAVPEQSAECGYHRYEAWSPRAETETTEPKEITNTELRKSSSCNKPRENTASALRAGSSGRELFILLTQWQCGELQWRAKCTTITRDGSIALSTKKNTEAPSSMTPAAAV